MGEGFAACPILFVWDGKWDCDANDRWKFNGKHSKMVFVSLATTFSELLEKAYTVSKVNVDEYKIEMSSWLAYAQQDPLPPCPLADDDDVRVFLQVNKEKTLSVPLCLVTRKRTNVIMAQTKKESASSNHGVFEALGTIVPETQPIMPNEIEKGKAIDTIGCMSEGQSPGLDDFDSFLYDELYGTTFGSPIGEQFTYDDEATTPVKSIPPVYDDPETAPCDPPVSYKSFMPPNPFNACDHCTLENDSKGKRKKGSVGTGHSRVSNHSRTIDNTCNSIPIENDFEVDQVFVSKSDLMRRLSLICMLKNREFKVKKSDSVRLVLVCVDSNCNWRLRASKLKNGTLWAVKRYHNIYTCSLDIMNHDHRQATSKVLGDLIKYRYTIPTHQYPPHAIMTEVKNKLNVNISYDKAWRAKEEAFKLIRGSPEDLYENLPIYLERVKQVNPGTVTHIETDEDNNFKYCFMAIGASINDFLSCIRLVLAVDGAHLKGKYRGTLFLATAMDGNNQIYPLAFGIGDSENDASWEWFFQKIYGIIGDLPHLVIISDRHKSIENGVHKVFQHAHHGICMQHLRMNVKARFKNVDVSALLICAAKSYNEAEFLRIMNEIRLVSTDVYNYLIDAGVERWARVHFSGRRYSIMTTNIAESLNAILRNVQEHPPIALLDGILMKLLTWFVERRETAAKMQTPLTTWAEKIVRSLDEMARRMDVQTLHHFTYYVYDGDRNAEVDLNQKTCICKVFQLNQLPCSHTMAAATKLNISRYGLASKFYTSDALVAAYAEPIFPVGHEDFWKISEEVSNIVVKPPLMRVPSGRRRKTRILSQGEDRVRRKCGRCGGVGHNRQTCKFAIPVPSST